MRDVVEDAGEDVVVCQFEEGAIAVSQTDRQWVLLSKWRRGGGGGRYDLRADVDEDLAEDVDEEVRGVVHVVSVCVVGAHSVAGCKEDCAERMESVHFEAFVAAMGVD